MATARSTVTEIRILPPHFAAFLPIGCLRVSIFCVRQALRQDAVTGCSHGAKSFRLRKELLVRVASTRSFQPFESKFNRDGDFEIPVAIFILQVERYAVTTGTAVVRAIEQAELI